MNASSIPFESRDGHRRRASSARGKPASGAAKATEPEAAAPAPEKLSCRHASAQERDAHSLQLIDQAQCRMVEALIAQAEQGSYLHARFLFELRAELRGQPRDSGSDRLAALLLEGLSLRPVSSPEPSAGTVE